jgi:acetoin utilization deacetylase AcuC-like enzyme
VPDYKEMGQMLSAMALPTVIVQEGGYFIERVPDLVEQFINGFSA